MFLIRKPSIAFQRHFSRWSDVSVNLTTSSTVNSSTFFSLFYSFCLCQHVHFCTRTSRTFQVWELKKKLKNWIFPGHRDTYFHHRKPQSGSDSSFSDNFKAVLRISVCRNFVLLSLYSELTKKISTIFLFRLTFLSDNRLGILGTLGW